jgi:hypothetical protein
MEIISFKERMSEISKKFSFAEKKIKSIEHLGEGLTFAAINELRYVAFHLVKFEELEDENHKEAELIKADNHCKRAIYDAAEVGIIHFLERIRLFQKDYRSVVVTDIIPDYVEFITKSKQIRDFIIEASQNSIEEHYNRQEHYERCSKFSNELENIVNILDNSRQEINKKLKNQRIVFLLSISALAFAVIGIIVTFLK